MGEAADFGSIAHSFRTGQQDGIAAADEQKKDFFEMCGDIGKIPGIGVSVAGPVIGIGKENVQTGFLQDALDTGAAKRKL